MRLELEAPSAHRLLDLIDGMAGQPVPMLVDLVADRFITGSPKRISREAPVLILRHESESTAPGGGANAVANVAALDGRPLPLGVVGDDAAGRELRKILGDLGVSTEGILVQPRYRTPTKTRVLGGARHAIKQQIVRFDVEDEIVLAENEIESLLSTLEHSGGRPKVAVLSDYGYGAVAPEMLPRLRQALGASCILLGDSRYRLADLAGLDGATPNAEEAEALLGRAMDGDLESLERDGRELLSKLAASFLLVTQGSDGMSLFTDEGATHLEVHGTDQVADVTGAGDTVIGTFALALAAGATPLEAACLANYAGGVVVMKMGTATLTRDELRAAVENDPAPLRSLRWHPVMKADQHG
ncbi:MAG: PfkB family carbohydrate kinase [Acidobacteriota bacterium]